MKIKKILAVAVLTVGGTTSSYAGNYTTSVVLGGGGTFTSASAYPGDTLPTNSTFDDYITFDAGSSGTYNIISHGYNYTSPTGSLIDYFNGSSSTALTYGADPSSGQFMYTGTLTLTAGHSYALHLTGTTNGSGNASYSGSITSAVPEPGTFAMLLAGMGLVGMVARRRNKAGAA